MKNINAECLFGFVHVLKFKRSVAFSSIKENPVITTYFFTVQ